MEYFTLARVIHVLAVIIWIGGVSMVTTVIIPSIKRLKNKEDKIDTFERLEGRFSFQAKIATVLTAISGFYMTYLIDGWSRFLELRFWWMHGMVLVWLIFTMILFVFEPLLLHRIFREYATKNPHKTFEIMHRAHWVLLIVSLLTTAGAVAGSYGWFF